MRCHREICSVALKYTIGVILPGLFFLTNPAVSQSTKYFEKIYPSPYPYFDDGWQVNTLPDGYIIACSRINAPLNSFAYIVKTDLFGQKIWETIIQDSTSNKVFFSGCVVNDGYVFAGYDQNISTGIARTFIYKSDTSGNQIWSKLIGDSTQSNFAGAINSTLDDGYILSGGIAINGQSWEAYLIKANSSGNVAWTQEYNGPLIDELWSTIQLNDGSYISAGHTNYALGSGSVRIIKSDTLGLQEWDTTYTFQNDTQTGKSIIKSIDGGYIIGGITGSGGSIIRGLIFKIDSASSLLWSKVLTEFSNGSGNPYVSTIRSVKELPDSTIICSGSIILTTGLPAPYNNRLLIIKLNKDGNEMWRRFYSPLLTGNTYGNSIDLTADGGFIISGRTESPNNADVYLLKTNCLGFIAAPEANFSYSVNGTNATFHNLSQSSDTCIYYFGDGDSALITHLDTIPVLHNYVSQGWFSAYIIAYACGESDTFQLPLYSGIDNDYEFMVNSFLIQPNPALDFLSINYQIPKNIKNVKLVCLDITGRLVQELVLDPFGHEYLLDISQFTPGSYMVYLQPDGMNGIAKKLVVLKK